jgi:carboxyl-terminal processing protease
LALFLRVVDRISAEYVDQKTGHELVMQAIRGLVRSLDNHSELIEDMEPGALSESFSGEFGGVGVELRKDQHLHVVRVFRDSPAARAGVERNDIVLKIDDAVADELTLAQALAAIKGRPGTTVRLEVRRGGAPPRTLPLERQMIRFRTADASRIDGDIAHVQITEFLDSTPAEVLEGIERLAARAPIRGVILDLRGNPGGVVESAVGVVSLFLPPNRLVLSSSGSRNRTARLPYMTSDTRYAAPRWMDLLLQPLVVVIDAKTASSAELVAAALKDHERAKVLGCGRSMGKGSIQSILPLTATTSLKITTARYLTPSGESIEGKGIEPDLAPKAVDVVACDRALLSAAARLLLGAESTPARAN